jgi:hypothetical protein
MARWYRTPLTLALVGFCWVASVQGQKACKQMNKQCEQFAPCCAEGQYCANNAFACMSSEGCDPEASYQGKGCTERPMCKSFKEEFNSPSALIDRYEYSGDPDAAKFWRQVRRFIRLYIVLNSGCMDLFTRNALFFSSSFVVSRG